MGLRLALPGSTGRLAPDQYFCVGIASHCSGPSAPCASNYARTFKRFSRSRAIRGRHAPPLGLHERSRARERNARPIARPLRVVWHRHLRSCPVHAVRRCPSSRVDAKQYLALFLQFQNVRRTWKRGVGEFLLFVRDRTHPHLRQHHIDQWKHSTSATLFGIYARDAPFFLFERDFEEYPSSWSHAGSMDRYPTLGHERCWIQSRERMMGIATLLALVMRFMLSRLWTNPYRARQLQLRAYVFRPAGIHGRVCTGM